MAAQRDWTPDSWRTKTASQMPVYPDSARLRAVLGELARLPPLVTSWEVESLKRHIAAATRGDVFVLQGGDCAESFEECESNQIAAKLKILLQMSLVLLYGCKKRVIRVGRFAGQYAKPRSSDFETRGGERHPSYRGDMVNRLGFTAAERVPDPERLLRAYERSALTLNFIRSLAAGGFADLHHPEYWDLGFVNDRELAARYQAMVDNIREAIQFVETVVSRDEAEIHRVDFYCSHEGLHLEYERAQTRQVPRRAGWYDLSTHFPWIGDRTRHVEGAHVEYFRGIENPIGVKIGPSISPDELVELVRRLDPEHEPGRLTLIHRFGRDLIEKHLPPLIETLRRAGWTVMWCCDPMHGNTEITRDGVKTRSFDRILEELEKALDVHAACGSILGGVHFELTGENVTECIGGACGLTESDLGTLYKSQVDPRLNAGQALEMAMLIAQKMKAMNALSRRR
jgi:3-deoxy-7-phosphoheptulonate synthase